MGPRDASTLCRLDAAQSQFQSHKDKYEKLRADVAIKLKFLEENKVGRGPWGREGAAERRAGVSRALAVSPGRAVCGWAGERPSAHLLPRVCSWPSGLALGGGAGGAG